MTDAPTPAKVNLAEELDRSGVKPVLQQLDDELKRAIVFLREQYAELHALKVQK